MSKTRRRWNAITGQMVGHDDGRLCGSKISKEQWVVQIVTRIVGTKAGEGFVTADDVVSDILLKLLDAGGFSWEEKDIEDFCRRKASYAVLRYLRRKERNECEFSNRDGEGFDIISIAGTHPARQELAFEAQEALGLLRALPSQHRAALEILCGGGNPINVADELGLTPWDAVRVIKEAREYVHRVDPLNEAA